MDKSRKINGYNTSTVQGRKSFYSSIHCHSIGNIFHWDVRQFLFGYQTFNYNWITFSITHLCCESILCDLVFGNHVNILRCSLQNIHTVHPVY